VFPGLSRKTIPQEDHPAQFSIRSDLLGDALVLGVSGDVDMTTAPEITRTIDMASEGSGTSLVVIDLSDVTFVDSTGLNSLVSCRRMLDAREIAMRVVVPEGGAIHRVFEITRLTEPLHVVGERARALADLQPSIS
jgi:anti-anti-sigma factor